MPNQDYPFRYRLKGDKEPYHYDRLIELLRDSLENMLNILVPVQGSEEVKIDGFKLLNDRKTTYQIFPPNDVVSQASISRQDPESSFQDINNASFYEPRIDFLRQQLESLLSVVELEGRGQVVEIDGFRLKDLNDWRSPSACEPVEIFGHLATRCNCDCVFCYLKGNPPSLALTQPRRTAQEEYEEVKTRIRYFSPEAKRTLFPSLGGIYEPLAHPHCLEALQALRGKTSKPFKIATNGERLTPELIAGLASLQPIYLYLSLNSSSPERRRRLMRSQHPQVAIDALPLLRDKGIPYAVVIVPWPMDSLTEMLEDLSATVSYAEENEAHLVEINLPGYSRYFSGQELFDLDEVWSATTSRVRKLREEIICPIVTMPSMYEENLYEEQKNLPRVIGVVKNSPASLCGLKLGDIILEINGLKIHNRPQARDILSLLQKGEEGQACLTIKRGSHELQPAIELKKFSYPYSRFTDNHLGVIFLGTGLRLSYIERLKGIIQSYKASHVLFLSSALVKPTLEQCLAETHLLGDPRFQIDIEIPRNKFFGGNIFMGDLLVVQDFIDYIKEYLERSKKSPDLIVIPSSPFNLGQWKRDLTGRVYLDIEREVGIPVELLECETIYD
jgi:wyosine [tRNA(Phe)-imidazoG37] synthetase (radical SAM superfamily)